MLYPKQQEIFKRIKPGSILPLGTGTGKTIISLWYYFANHYNNNTPLYIIAPAIKVNEGGWDREINFICNTYKLTIPKYEVISYSKVHKIDKLEKGFFIIDEAHYIKNSIAIISSSVRKLLKLYATDFIFLTATPGTKIEVFTNYFIIWGYAKIKLIFIISM